MCHKQSAEGKGTEPLPDKPGFIARERLRWRGFSWAVSSGSGEIQRRLSFSEHMTGYATDYIHNDCFTSGNVWSCLYFFSLSSPPDLLINQNTQQRGEVVSGVNVGFTIWCTSCSVNAMNVPDVLPGV